MRSLVIGLVLLALVCAAPAASADHTVVCVDDPVCYALCQVDRALLFLDGEGHLPECIAAWS